MSLVTVLAIVFISSVRVVLFSWVVIIATQTHTTYDINSGEELLWTWFAQHVQVQVPPTGHSA